MGFQGGLEEQGDERRVENDAVWKEICVEAVELKCVLWGGVEKIVLTVEEEKPKRKEIIAPSVYAGIETHCTAGSLVSGALNYKSCSTENWGE